MSVPAILKKHARPSILYAAEPVKYRLLSDLRAQKRHNKILYGTLFMVVSIITFAGVAGLLLDLSANQQVRTGILAAAGVGLPAMLVWMRRVVREWSQVSLLITLVSHSNETAIQSLIEKLLSSAAIGLEPAAPPSAVSPPNST